MPIQLIWLLPSPVSPAESRPTPLTSPTLGSSRRLSVLLEDAALLASLLDSAEDASEDAPLSSEETALLVCGDWLGAAGGLLLGAGGVLLGAGGSLLGAGGSLLGAGGSLLGAGGSLLGAGASLETVSNGGKMSSSEETVGRR